LRRFAGRTDNSGGAADSRLEGTTIGGSDIFSGGGDGGGVIPLLPDCAAALTTTIAKRISRNGFVIASLPGMPQ